MKHDHFEEFIKNNREDFDFREPSSGTWDKIAKNLSKKRIVTIRQQIIRIAAIFAAVVVTTVLAYYSNIIPLNGIARGVKDPELKELIEAEAFYAHKVDSRLEEIRKCYNTYPELKDEVENDLIELEGMYNVLKKDLQENISSKAVIEAMIENNRYRLKLVDDVLEKINC